MNAPLVDPSRRQYVPTVNALMPGTEGDELDIRCSLLLMRDCAAAAKARCSDEAYPILDQVESLASRYAFQGMAVEKLDELRTAMRKVVAAAACLDDWAGKGVDVRG
jgi:hypothetical protein